MSTMQKTAFVLTCLACVSNARQGQTSQRYQNGPSVENLHSHALAETGKAQTLQGMLTSLDALALLLEAFHPASAFSLSGPISPERQPGGDLAHSRLSRRMAMLRMSDEGEEKFAVKPQEEFQDPTELTFKRYAVFYGRVTVSLGPQFKPLVEDFKPSWPDDTSAMATAKVPYPVGMQFQESGRVPGRFEVLAIEPGGNAEKAGMKPGDLIRGVTAIAQNTRAMQAAIEKDVVYSLSGGTTGPNIDKGMERAFFVADGQSFEGFCKALISNKYESGGPDEAVFAIERNNPFELE